MSGPSRSAMGAPRIPLLLGVDFVHFLSEMLVDSGAVDEVTATAISP
jgi:hypothetical protein